MSLCRFVAFFRDTLETLETLCTLFALSVRTFILVPFLLYLVLFTLTLLFALFTCGRYVFLSVVFFFFCFLYINFCSDSFDIFCTFFTSVKFFASCTPVFYPFDTRFPLLCYQNDRKCQKCQLCHVIFYPSFFFFERSIQKLSVSCC